jgi:hypothetical protein
MRKPQDHLDSGSVAVEFLAALVLLAVVFIASLEVAMYVYVRNVAQAAAVEAARYGAPVGRGDTAAALRIGELMPTVLGGYAKGFQVRTGRSGDFVFVVIEGKVTPITPLIPELPIKVEARAFREEEAISR